MLPKFGISDIVKFNNSNKLIQGTVIFVFELDYFMFPKNTYHYLVQVDCNVFGGFINSKDASVWTDCIPVIEKFLDLVKKVYVPQEKEIVSLDELVKKYEP